MQFDVNIPNPMQIANIQIRNFRGIKSGSIDFAKHSVLIGPNNCGKTTIIEALALLLGRDKLVRSLTEHDFYASNPKPTDRIYIIASELIDYNFRSKLPTGPGYPANGSKTNRIYITVCVDAEYVR